MIQEHFNNIETEKEAEKLTQKLNSVIENLIYKEGILMITKDDKVDANKVLTINYNYIGSDLE